jgi:transcriptional regulator with XRE-family HTH domain
VKPDASNHNPDPRYLRGLREKTGLTQRQLADLFGMGRRMIQYYEADEGEPSHRPATYLYQYALEQLAGH